MPLAAIRAVALVAGLLFSAPSWSLDRNGNWWLAQPNGDRLTYVIGFFDGMHFALDRAASEFINPFQGMNYPQPRDEACAKLRADQTFTNWKSLLAAHDDFKGVTAGQLVAGIDTMFADYRNRSISVKDVLGVVVWSIKGGDQKMIDGRLTYLRSQK